MDTKKTAPETASPVESTFESTAETTTKPTINCPNPPRPKFTPPAQPRRRLRRQINPNLITGPGAGVLLNHEDGNALEALRVSVRDHFNAKSTLELVLAELATASAWRALRALDFEGSSIDTEVEEQTEAVDREYEEIDGTCRAGLVFKDPAFTRILRQFNQSNNQNVRSLISLLRLRSGKASS